MVIILTTTHQKNTKKKTKRGATQARVFPSAIRGEGGMPGSAFFMGERVGKRKSCWGEKGGGESVV